MAEQNIVNYYEAVASESDFLYSGSGFMSYGYWDKDINTPAEASRNLVLNLISYFENTNGTLLNVACGNGSETQILAQYFSPRNITAINISKLQLERAAKKSPDVKFIQMSATDLQFQNDSFDNVICIEAAFHFDTRQKFLSESFRILKPGGKIVIADILFKSNFFLNKNFFPKGNNLKHLKDYKKLLLELGYTNIDIHDVTYSTFKPFKAYIISKLVKSHPIAVIRFIMPRIINLSSYVFIVAEKPEK